MCALFVAQKEGFEPSRAFYTPTPLAGEPLRPLGYFCTLPLKYNSIAHRRCQEVYLRENVQKIALRSALIFSAMTANCDGVTACAASHFDCAGSS